MKWKIKFSRRALKDTIKLKAAGLDRNVKQLLEILRHNPFAPPYEKLSGNLKGYYSRRINIQHRLVYSVDQTGKVIRIDWGAS